MIQRRVMELQILVFARLDSAETARVIQATEYERRLALLNGEHATLNQMKNDFVQSLGYNKDLDSIRTEMRALRTLIDDNRQTQETAAQTTRRNAMVAWTGFATAAIGWAISWFLTRKPP
jgi:hypothetical protein